MNNQEKYLYGAAVQGIQSFIFQTNKLREIVGASELVEQICTTKFEEVVGKSFKEYDDNSKCGSILRAAGNIKYIFATQEECEEVVRKFPKIVSEFAPGITISQAVVKMEDDKFETAVNELERRLRIQRNKPMRSATLGLMGIERSRQTGLPVVLVKPEKHYGKSEELHIDAATKAKLYDDAKGDKKKTTVELCSKAFLPIAEYDKEVRISVEQIPFDIEQMTGSNDWVAVIHADGNGLGQIVQKVGKDANAFMNFSKDLDNATRKAAYKALKSIQQIFNLPEIKQGSKGLIPIRPIVLGGDDLTVICRADLALDYVTNFIDEFEKQTQFVKDYKLSFDRLTACAGIAYIKSSYPFYYGYNLAEALCSAAKKDAKASLKDGELAASCLMFHKVQDSFTENWEDIVKRELTPQDNISFCFGPYYLKEKENRWTIRQLMDNAMKLEGKEGNAVKSHLRNWMSLLHSNPAMAEQKLLRLKSIITKELKDFVERITNDKDGKPIYKRVGKEYYPVYDMLAIHTINTQNTKNNKED